MVDQADEKNIDVNTGKGAAALEMQVQCRLGRQVRDFRVVVGDNGLLLRGHAFTYYAKQLAQHAVMEATDLSIQANEIDVS